MSYKKTNPFSLQSPSKSKETEPQPKLSEESIKERLEGYIEVPKDLWSTIKYPHHVRYYKAQEDGSQGEFKVGGFIKNNPIEYSPKGESEKVVGLRLQSSLNASDTPHYEWVVAYSEIHSIHVKMTTVEQILLRGMIEAVGQLNKNIEILKDKCSRRA